MQPHNCNAWLANALALFHNIEADRDDYTRKLSDPGAPQPHQVEEVQESSFIRGGRGAVEEVARLAVVAEGSVGREPQPHAGRKEQHQLYNHVETKTLLQYLGQEQDQEQHHRKIMSSTTTL